MSWIKFLDKSIQSKPNKIAVIDQNDGRKLSYQELKTEIDQWATWLDSYGVTKGDPVVFIESNCLEHITLFLACAKIGAIFVPMNWRLSDGEKQEIINRINPKIILSKSDCDLFHSCVHLSINSMKRSQVINEVFNEPSLNEPLLMLFTSGTTGTPKGVLLHGQMLETNQIGTCENWQLTENDITVVETPFFHTGGYNVLCLPLLYLGGTVIIASKFDPVTILNTIEKEKVTVYFGVPTMFQLIRDSRAFESADLTSLRFLVSGGAYCPIELIHSFQEKGLNFKQGFGLTEVGPNCFLLKEEDSIRKLGSIGKPMSHSEVLLMKNNGEEAMEGEVGELLIKGNHLCKGYFAEAKRFENTLSQGYFRTGDLASFDSEGFFSIVGRKKDMYISGGENVYPAEVEKKILTHPKIKNVVVVSVPSPKWGEVGLAYLETQEQLTLKEMKNYLGPILSKYKHPHFLKEVTNFPVLESGKINRNLLKQDALDMVLME